MLRNAYSSARAARGFNLIELMISIVIGMLVAAGATSLIVAINQANAVTISSSHLTQELRTTLEIIAADLRRARRVDDSFGVIGQVAIQSSNNITVAVITDPITESAAKDCIAYAYVGGANNSASGTDPSNGVADNSRGGINFSVVHRVANGSFNSVAIASSWPNPVATTTAVPAGYDCTNPTTGTIISSDQVDITGLKFEPASSGAGATVDNDAIKVTISGRLRFRGGINYGSGSIADRQLTQIVSVRSPKAGL